MSSLTSFTIQTDPPLFINVFTLTLSAPSFSNRRFHPCIYTHPLLPKDDSCKIKKIMANSVDPDEMARYEPSRLIIHCLQVCMFSLQS